MSDVVDELKRLEHAGYHFEVADASLEMLLRRAAGQTFDYFRVESFKVLVERGREAEFDTEATLRIVVGDERRVTVGEGDGPVNALDNAFRNAVRNVYPDLDAVRLTDYKVRVLDADRGTEAVTRVLIDSTDGETTWTTIGVSENIIEASWLALRDSLIYALMRHRLETSPSAVAEFSRCGRRFLDCAAMAAPRHVRVGPLSEVRAYSSPEVTPRRWRAERPGDLAGGPAHWSTARTPRT